MITTANFHLTKACNFTCKFCYATFNDISSKGLNKQNQLDLIKLLSESKLFRKINFAGGEPTLVPHITELIRYAKNLGFETSIVTNASKIDSKWIKEIAPHLDILALSIDSIENSTNIASGRNEKGQVISIQKLIEIIDACHLVELPLKVNTVVFQNNKHEKLTEFINKIKPFRWKILQVTKVEGQNDSQFEVVSITENDFVNFCNSNKNGLNSNIKFIEESASVIQGSYLMIDMLGRFFDNSELKHNYSQSILSIGVEKALKQVNVDTEKFEKREGNYTVNKTVLV